MSSSDLQHVHWLVSHLIRDEAGHFTIAPQSLAHVERAIQAGLDDPSTADELIEQILRLAHGALNEGGELELARTLVSMLLAHPLGLARLEQSETDKGWSKFAAEPARRAPVHDGPAPQGSVSLGSLYNKRRTRF